MAAVFGRGVRSLSGARAACLGGVCGMLLLLLVARQAPPASRLAALLESSRRRAVIPWPNDAVASRIRREPFGGRSTRAARQLQLAWHERERAVRAMLDEEEEGDAGAEDDGGEETPADAADDNEYARFVWRKQRLQTDWGVNVDSWGRPDRAGVGERPYTAGHLAADDIAEAANSTVGSGGDLSGHAGGNASLSNGIDVPDDRYTQRTRTHTRTRAHAHTSQGGCDCTDRLMPCRPGCAGTLPSSTWERDHCRSTITPSRTTTRQRSYRASTSTAIPCADKAPLARPSTVASPSGLYSVSARWHCTSHSACV